MSFCSNSITWPLPLGSLWISPKLKTYLSLFLFYLFQTNLLTSHRLRLLMVSPLWFLSACLCWHHCCCFFFFFWGGGCPAINDLGWWIPASELDRRLYALLEFCFYTVGMAGTCPSLHSALMWEGSFDDLIWSALHGQLGWCSISVTTAAFTSLWV